MGSMQWVSTSIKVGEDIKIIAVKTPKILHNTDN
jgi:hypothetical protein